ncbi:hypothetical protein DOTSEDRAFT_47001 [Dothistroma septosporum NZE10]|uniref:Uncharacterized protein n=1 Tax=Dothistroma septosporum (strain NZE10 / CBS 128990) TaxID=675120 RepID=N1PHF1_DOTSN|nr:hypothetical protein DOTSEDRAFT_47001 [Dothistroma septosporum NZE10]
MQVHCEFMARRPIERSLQPSPASYSKPVSIHHGRGMWKQEVDRAGSKPDVDMASHIIAKYAESPRIRLALQSHSQWARKRNTTRDCWRCSQHVEPLAAREPRDHCAWFAWRTRGETRHPGTYSTMVYGLF